MGLRLLLTLYVHLNCAFLLRGIFVVLALGLLLGLFFGFQPSLELGLQLLGCGSAQRRAWKQAGRRTGRVVAGKDQGQAGMALVSAERGKGGGEMKGRAGGVETCSPV